MRRIVKSIFIFLCIISTVHADEAYLNKFLTYTYWLQHMPTEADQAFLNFVATPSPLTSALREKWLMQLAKTHHWAIFIQYYDQFQQSAPIQSNDLHCY